MKYKITLGLLLFSTISVFAQIDTLGFSEAKILYSNGDLNGAKKLLKKIEKSEPDFAPCLYYLGLVYHDEQDYKTAKKYYLMAGEKDKNYGEPYSDLASLMFAQQNYDEAIEFAKISIQRDSTNAKAYINMASSLYQIKKYDEAKEYFIKSAQVDPIEILNLGDAMLRQYQQPQAAIYYFSIVYEVYPDLPIAVLNLGNTFRMIGDSKTAMEIFTNGYNSIDAKDEMFGLIYSNYFRLLFDNKEYEKIIKTAFDKVPIDYPSGYFFISLSNYGLGNKDLFIVQANKYFELSGDEKPVDLDNWAKTKFK
jgi:tetratricopeptide (TPR) repeat protein